MAFHCIRRMARSCKWCTCFSNSSLYKKGQSNFLFPDFEQKIAGNDIPLVILGDPAYLLLQWLMKAFPNNEKLITPAKTFNYQLSKARVVVEHWYGRLKERWRCLLKRLDVEICVMSQKLLQHVVFCMCEIHEATESAINIRNAFMLYFSQ